MLCKKCGETFNDELKACPKCGMKKPVGRRKKFKVELPEDIKPKMSSDDFISSTTKIAPQINKVVVDSEQTQKNKTRNTRYIDKDAEETIKAQAASTPVSKPASKPVSKPVARPQAAVKSTPPVRKPAKKPMFKVEIPEEYATLDLATKKDKAKPQEKPQAQKAKPSEVKAEPKQEPMPMPKVDEQSEAKKKIDEAVKAQINATKKADDVKIEEPLKEKISTKAEPKEEASTKAELKEEVSVKAESTKTDISEIEPKNQEQSEDKDDFHLFVGEDLYLQDDEVEEEVKDQIKQISFDEIEDTISNPIAISKPKPLSETMQRFEEERKTETNADLGEDLAKDEQDADEIAAKLEEEKARKTAARVKHWATPKMSKAEKRMAENSLLSIKIIAVVMFVLLGVLTLVSTNTDFFEVSAETKMTLSFINVSDEQTQEVQDFLSQVSMFLSLESYGSDDFSASEILDMIEPYSDSGLYTAFFDQADLVYDNNDPAGRYTEDGERYYKIAKSEIDQIITSLGIETVSMVIEEDYYLYEDYYYFSVQEQTSTIAQTYSVQIDKIKQTVEGAYYAEIELLDDSGNTVYDRYVVVNVSTIDEVSTYSLEVLSDESLFNSFGEMKTLESEETELYSIQREVLELETSDGIVLYEYIIDYPVFEGDSQLELVINQMYSDLISAYNMETELIDAEYEVYSSGGISDDTFPMCVYIDVTVEMYSEQYLTILQQVIEEQTVQDEDTNTALYTNSLSSYNYMIQDSSAVKLSDIVGSDKTTLYEILYRLYYGYDIEEVLTGEYLETSYYSYWQQPDEDEVPDDEDGIGEDIYDGCYVLTEDGVIFFYETDFGYYEEILLNNDTISAILAMETE